MTSPAPIGARSTLLSKVGTVAATAVKHVPTRMALWGVIGFVVGVIGVALSYVIGVLVMGRGAMILGALVVIPMAIPPLGAALFATHGLHRGAARAALALEGKFGLVSHVVDRVLTMLADRFGEKLANLPLHQLEVALKEVVATYLASKEEDEGKGMVAYVVRRARTGIARRIDSYLLAAYREELKQDGSGGGLSVQKVRERATTQMSSRLGELVMSPLNKQLVVFMVLYLLVACGWWFWLFLIVVGCGTLPSHLGGRG
jgi:hypothetical protein